jgi:hypothetical protein
MSLSEVRIAAGVVALLCAGILVYRRRAVAASLQTFFFEPSPPQNLALLRVAVFGTLAWVGSHTRAVWWASQPAALRMLPPGWGWLDGTLPIDASTATFAQYAVVACSACAALGLLTRITAPIAAIAAVYLLGTPSFFGKILHVDHALVMMALVLAASPCGDAWSLDRLVRRSRGVAPAAASAAYTLPIRLCWLLFGTIYLFPGIWKLWEAGDIWLSGERLLWELQDEWGQRKYLKPPMRIDQYPWLLKLLGAATLVFELGFFFAMFNRWTRIAAVLGAVAFHVSVRLFLGIRFYEYLPLVLLIDFPFRAPAVAASLRRSLWPSAMAGSALLLGQFYVGFAQIDTWPIAMHPKFSERGGPKSITRNHKFALEPRGGGRERDIVYVLQKLGGGHGFTRVMIRFDGEVARGLLHKDKSRSIVTMLRDNGLTLQAGDHIAVYKTSWDTYPIGKRQNYKKTFLRRYRVTEDGGLEVVATRAS